MSGPFPMGAARRGDLAAVTAWRAAALANEVDADFPFDEWRPLHLACAEGDGVAVDTILRAGGDAGRMGTSRFLPNSGAVHVAARYGHSEVTRDAPRPPPPKRSGRATRPRA